MSDTSRPHGLQPTTLLRPWDFPGKSTGVGCHCLPALQIEGETVEIVTDFLSLGSKITADSDCSHEIRRQLLLGRKAMTNLDGLLKSRDIILPTKVHIVKPMVFPVVTYSCVSWTIRKQNAKNYMPLYCAGEDSWKPLGQQRDQTRQF